MNMAKRILSVVLIGACVAAGAQNATHSSAKKAGKPKPKSEEQILLEQLDQKFEALDQLTKSNKELLQRVNTLQEQLETARQDAAAAKATAEEARQKVDLTQQVVGPNGDAVAKLQTEVSSLKGTSSSLAEALQTNQLETKKLENPESIHFRGIELKPGGFLAAETVNRQRGTGSDVTTPFSSIPFAGTTAGLLSEFNAGGRQSRISLLAEGKLPTATIRGYYEADFLSAGTTSNDNQSNSYTLRLRQAWAQAALSHGWTVTGGQMWSLATEYKHGLDNNAEAVPLTIDSQYNAGFTWARQYGFRVVKRLGSQLWLGGAVEEAQTLNIGGHNLPTIAYQETGSGSYGSTSNYSFNAAPDVLAKIAYENRLGHYELFGVGRFFRDRVFPNAQNPSGATQKTSTSAEGAYTSKTAGGGVGANARVSLFNKRLDLGAHGLVGNGLGRYSTSTLPDATAHTDGSLELLTGGSALGSLEYHATRRLDLYAYYGGEYAKRAYYNTGYTVVTAGPTYGQYILGGYGAPNNDVSGCYTETLPSNGDASGASSTTCMADNRNIQEGTADTGTASTRERAAPCKWAFSIPTPFVIHGRASAILSREPTLAFHPRPSTTCGSPPSATTCPNDAQEGQVRLYATSTGNKEREVSGRCFEE